MMYKATIEETLLLRCLARLSPHADPVHRVTSLKKLAVGVAGRQTGVSKALPGELVELLNGPLFCHTIHEIFHAFWPSSSFSVIGYAKMEADIWSLATNADGVLYAGSFRNLSIFQPPSFTGGFKQVSTTEISQRPVTAILPLEKSTIVGDEDGSLFRIAQDGTISQGGRASDWIHSIVSTQHGLLVGTSRSLELFDPVSLTPKMKFDSIPEAYSLALLSEDIVAVGSDKKIYILNLKSGAILAQFDADHCVYSIVCSESHIYALSFNGTLYVIDKSSVSLIQSNKILDGYCYSQSLALVPNAPFLIAKNHQKILILSLSKESFLNTIHSFDFPSTHLTISPDGTLFVSYDYDITAFRLSL